MGKPEDLVEEIRRKLDAAKTSNEEKSPVKTPDLRNPEEVKEYLDGLYVEYSYQCVSEKRPDGCHRLANFLENIRKEYEAATDIYKKNCDEYKFPRSCSTYAKNRTLGRGCKKDLLEACKYSFISCDLGVAEGCLNAGICLSDGVGGLPRNIPNSLGYLNKACDAQNTIACMKLFNLYISDKLKEPGWQRDPVKAYEYAKRSCDMNDILGCLNAARQTGIGDGISKDLKLSDEFRQKADELKRELDSAREQQGINFGEQHK